MLQRARTSSLKNKRNCGNRGHLIVENKALAQVLYRTVDLGETIPESLYNAVAEILAFVYSMKERVLKLKYGDVQSHYWL